MTGIDTKDAVSVRLWAFEQIKNTGGGKGEYAGLAWLRAQPEEFLARVDQLAKFISTGVIAKPPSTRVMSRRSRVMASSRLTWSEWLTASVLMPGDVPKQGQDQTLASDVLHDSSSVGCFTAPTVGGAGSGGNVAARVGGGCAR